MASEPEKLLRLATEKFADRELSTAEKLILRCVEAGEEAKGTAVGGEFGNNPARANEWGQDRVIQADLVAWLCTNSEAANFIGHLGLRISGMRFDGILDVRHSRINFPVRIMNCAFTEIIGLTGAEIPFLSLEGCHVMGIVADGMRVRGSLFLRAGFTSIGEVRIPGASIDGNLELDGAQLLNQKGVTLNGQGTMVHGSVFLRNGFVSRGEARLIGISVDSSFSCIGGLFSNPNGVALIAERAELKSGVFLSDKFRSEGQTRFSAARIRGGLDCGAAHFSNPNGRAFHGDRMEVDGDVFFRGATIDGELRLVGAKIDGNFECDGASLNGFNGKALILNGTKVDGNAFLRDKLHVTGEIDLVGARIGSHLVIRNIVNVKTTALNLTAATAGSLEDNKNAWPESGKLLLDGFRYDRIADQSPRDAGSRTEWLQRQPADTSWPQPYEQLATVLRDMGHDRDAREIMIEKNRERRRFTRFPRQDWWWYNFFGRTIGYGYKPFRALVASLAMVLIGATLFAWAFSHDLISPTKETTEQKRISSQVVNHKRHFAEDYNVFNPVIYSLEQFIPFLKLDEASNWQPNPNRGENIWYSTVTQGQFVRYYLWFHICIGWILTSLWVGAVTGLVKS
jgi:hypothetical protein